MFHTIWSFTLKALPSSYSQLNETTFTQTTVFYKDFVPITLNKVDFEEYYEKIDYSEPLK